MTRKPFRFRTRHVSGIVPWVREFAGLLIRRIANDQRYSLSRLGLTERTRCDKQAGKQCHFQHKHETHFGAPVR